MITADPVAPQAGSPSAASPPRPGQPAQGWQALWRDAVRDPSELLALLELPPRQMPVSASAAVQFPLRVPRGFVARMRRGDPADPLLRQVLPVTAEDERGPGFVLDPVGDTAARQGAGLIHKYQGRALLIATGSCAVHCRYCFRRHFAYSDETASAGEWAAALEHLAADSSISEVILSGGDPLSLSTAKLGALTDRLQALPHVRRLRLHTRLPVVLPERVDDELLRWLRSLPWPVCLVIHANHGNEIDGKVAVASAALRATGATVLNQSVLLHGVNDSIDVLEDLSVRLFDIGVLPYYLHQLDRVAGAAHFQVGDDRARALHAGLRERLPGYLLPRLVREIAGASAKTQL